MQTQQGVANANTNQDVNVFDGSGNAITSTGGRLDVAATQSGTWTEANSAAIKTAVETIDNAISGNEMQVDIVAALPAGDNNIGNVDIITNPADVTSSGTITALDGTLNPTLIQGGSDLGFQITGTWTGQIEFEVTIDGATWVPTRATSEAADNSVNATTTNGVFITPVAGVQGFRLRASSWSSGTANGFFRASLGVHTVNFASPIPSGDNNIGNVDIASIAAGDNNIGNVDLASAIPAGTNNIGDVDVLTIGGQTPDFGEGDATAATIRISPARKTPHVLSGTSGTEVITGEVVFISGIALEAAGTIAITGHDTITIPYGSTDSVSSSVEVPFLFGPLINPTITFTGTDSYVVVYYD